MRICQSTLSNKWQKVFLGEVVEFLDSQRKPITEKDRQPGPYPYYGANGQQDSIAEFLFDEPLILLAEDGGHFENPEKTIAYQVSGKFWVNNHAHVLRPKDCINIRFLCRHIERYNVIPFITGTTRGKLTKAAASRIPLVLPPLEEQHRIAAILDKADAIRRKREETIRLTEELLRAAFLDMFGDPVTNPKGWQVVELQQLCSKIVDCPHETPKYSEDITPYPCIRSSDIQKGYIDLSTTKYVDEYQYKIRTKRHIPVADDIIYCREGARFGNAAQIPKNISPCLGQRMMLLQIDKSKAEPIFLCSLLNTKGIYLQASQLVAGSASPHVNVGDIKKFKVFNPSLERQLNFKQFSEINLRLRQKLLYSLDVSNLNFNSLLHRAFRGRL